ncbi:glycosyltransferase family 87 protein [Granulicella sibirica]|uniref:Putative conserved integral membrane protein n=1 Tax=Granulicella sibirica TaxID=2479048 RepID=A0A4Q0SYR5_9BACT|nr:glycosyltransferase family 87 protein [Granulicella sibirica]RXH54186.1 putative conserved integral membrane protein [Granulicella sibirica]
MATEIRTIPLPRASSTPSPALQAWVRVEWLLLFICAGVFALRTVPSAFATLQTDFPNYYLTAKLAREGVDTAHVYEWRWLARQKDHHEIDRSVIGLVPITPFSTLAVAPLAGFKPLIAKRIWLVFQIALLLPIVYGLREMTGQPLRRIALIVLGCPPLHRNLLYGQFYVLLTALLIGACWAHQRKRMSLAGALVAIATAIKLFPVVFCLYFLRKREWRALLAAVATGAACIAVSVSVFGWEVHRTYLRQILPWTLRGEGFPPYALGSGSLSTLLHCLFVYEPQWNPQPWHPSPVFFVVLQAVLPMVILAPALLLCDERDDSASRVALEWSALTVGTLTVSTIPASYNFTLLVLPMTVLVAWLLRRRSSLAWLAIVLYVGIGLPSGWDVGSASGLGAVLQVPRLYMLVALAAVFYVTMGSIALHTPKRRRVTLAIGGILALVAALQVASGLHHQRGLYDDFAYRIPDASGALLTAAPGWHDGDVLRIAMQPTGYRLLEHMSAPPSNVPFSESAVGPDEISFATNNERVLVESAGARSTITSRGGGHLQGYRRCRVSDALPGWTISRVPAGSSWTWNRVRPPSSRGARSGTSFDAKHDRRGTGDVSSRRIADRCRACEGDLGLAPSAHQRGAESRGASGWRGSISRCFARWTLASLQPHGSRKLESRTP